MLRLKGIFSEPEDADKGDSILGENIFVHSPLASKLYLDLPKPNLEDKISDLERLYRQIRSLQDLPVLQTGLSNIRRLGELLRSSDWKITATLGKRNGTTEIVILEPGDTSKRNLGFAFDIGTTTICGQLIDLNTKKYSAPRPPTISRPLTLGCDYPDYLCPGHRRPGEIASRGN